MAQAFHLRCTSDDGALNVAFTGLESDKIIDREPIGISPLLGDLQQAPNNRIWRYEETVGWANSQIKILHSAKLYYPKWRQEAISNGYNPYWTSFFFVSRTNLRFQWRPNESEEKDYVYGQCKVEENVI